MTMQQEPVMSGQHNHFSENGNVLKESFIPPSAENHSFRNAATPQVQKTKTLRVMAVKHVRIVIT